MAITNSSIDTLDTTIYTSVGDNAITTVIVCNTAPYNPNDPTSGETTLYMYAVPNGADLSPVQLIVNGLPIPAGETVSFDQEKMVLSDGDSLVARSDSPANLVVTVSTLAV